MTLTRQEIRDNRLIWIKALKDPSAQKETRQLANLATGGMCCLGHGAEAFNLRSGEDGNRGQYGEFRTTANAPHEFVRIVGLWGESGYSRTRYPYDIPNFGSCLSLVYLNDYTGASPQQIGAYLETIIEGGDDTPFRPLTDYPEAA